MAAPWWQREWLRNCAGYALAVVLSVALVVWILRLWNTDLGTPYGYSGDAHFTMMQVRTVLEHGWYLNNPRLGMPFGCEMYDFPLPESLHFAAMKVLGWCGCDFVAAVNLYFLLTFPLTTVTSYFVLRHFGRTRGTALVAGLLFAFLPYHFFRGTWHLFLACYYLVPLAVMLVLWVYREPGFLFVGRDGDNQLRLRLLSWPVLAGVLLSLLLASGGVYYAFFTCFFLGVFAARRRSAASTRS